MISNYDLRTGQYETPSSRPIPKPQPTPFSYNVR